MPKNREECQICTLCFSQTKTDKFDTDVGVLLEHSQHGPEAGRRKTSLLTRKNTYDKYHHDKNKILKYWCNRRLQKGLKPTEL